VRELEFLPTDYLQARYQRRIGFIRSWLLLALGLAMVLWSMQMGAWVRHAQAELESLRGTDNAVRADVQKVRMLQTETRFYEHRIELLRTLRPQVRVTQILAAVTETLPEGIALNTTTVESSGQEPHTRTRVTISGQASSETAVAHALSALEGSPTFERPILLESKPVQVDGAARQFVIDVAVTVPAGKE
jgi:hypothetical protein